MHEIPETMAQAEALATKLAWPLDKVIQRGIQNWAQQLLDEGVEGGYLTPSSKPTACTSSISTTNRC